MRLPQYVSHYILLALITSGQAFAWNPEGHQTVGIRLDISHVAATPVGMRVRAHAELIKVDGRKLTFRVSAEDEKEPIGQGVHERIVVNVARFDKRTQEKASREWGDS